MSLTEACQSRDKVSIEADEVRRGTEDKMVEIWGNRREGNLERKRIEGPHVIESTAAGVRSADPAVQLEATAQFRKLLSTEAERNPLIEEVVKSGLVPHFVQFLGRVHEPRLQSGAAWVLGEIASVSPKNSLLIIDQGAVPTFLKLLGSASVDVREEVVSALVKISCAYSKCIDDGLRPGASSPPPPAPFNEDRSLPMLGRVPFAFSGFFAGSNVKKKAALMVLKGLLCSEDDGILANACRGLHFFLAFDSYEGIQAVIDAGFCPILVELLRRPSSPAHIPALYVVVSISAGDDVQSQAILDHGALPCLKDLLTNTHEKIVIREACTAIANIAAGTDEQTGAVIEAGLIPLLVRLAETESDEYLIKRAAILAISNTTLRGSCVNISRMVREGGMKALCDMLIGHGAWISRMCLGGLEDILRAGELEKAMSCSGGVNEYAQMIVEFGGLKKIREIKNWPLVTDFDFGEEAAKILRTYWVEEEEEEVPAGGASQNGLQFGGDECPLPPGGSEAEVRALRALCRFHALFRAP